MGSRVDCACGAAYSTPHGENDAVAFVQWHVGQIHSEDYPEGISRDDAPSLVKTE